MTKRVLLTGATGFIGRQAIAPLRERGFEVHAVSHGEVREPLGAVSFHQADLLDPDAVRALLDAVRPTHLLHFAWFATPGQYWTSPENLRWVSATTGLLQAFAGAGGQRVVMAGTCAEYDWQAGHCVENQTPLAPSSLYGASKRAMGLLLEAAAPVLQVSTAWGRIFFLHGPWEHPLRLVPSVARALLRGEPVDCTDGSQVRDFLHVADVAGAFVALLDSPVEGAVNIASGQVIPVRDVILGVANRLGAPALVRLGALPPGGPPVLSAETRRLRDEVGWVPRFGLEDGLDDTVAWWRQHQAFTG